LLNPEGFRHAPFSLGGCVLFVKLRQYPGKDRQHIAINTNSLPWCDSGIAGVAHKPLYSQDGYSDSVELQKWKATTSPGKIVYPEGAEIFVIDGTFRDENGSYGKGFWLRFPMQAAHSPRTDTGCVIYVKKGGFEYLVPEIA
ncbi:MAG: anti-sigma factor, partial [Burkholderiales bacterium]|nr:anti-sigma factor [Burkholderiales bacterium]